MRRLAALSRHQQLLPWLLCQALLPLPRVGRVCLSASSAELALPWRRPPCRIGDLSDLLQRRDRILQVVESEADELAAKFGTPRRSTIITDGAGREVCGVRPRQCAFRWEPGGDLSAREASCCLPCAGRWWC